MGTVPKYARLPRFTHDNNEKMGPGPFSYTLTKILYIVNNLENSAEGLKTLRKILYLFLIISFFIINSSLMVRANPIVKNENSKEITEENQQIKTKTKKYKWEFSSAASFYFEPEVYEKDKLGIYIPARIGCFITKNIEIEPEFNITYRDSEFDSITRNLLFANLAYNFFVSSRIMPFLLAGAGIIKLEEEVYIEWPRIYNKLVLNAGAGFKWLFVRRVAMRIEYRIIHYRYTTRHNMLIGISVFI